MRQAVADVVDREKLAKDVYNNTYSPLYSMVPDGLTGAATPFKTLYGDGNGGADVDKAKKTLSDAGVSGKVQLDIQYAPDHYGSTSDDEYAELKTQLENSGLFTVNIQSTVYTTYAVDRTKDAYPCTSSVGSRTSRTRTTTCRRSSRRTTSCRTTTTTRRSRSSSPTSRPSRTRQAR